MRAKRLRDIIIFSIKKLQEPYYLGFAEQLAFYFMLSIVPVIILLTQALMIFSIPIDSLFEYARGYLSPEAYSFLVGVFSYQPAGGINITLVLIALWAASKAQFSLTRVANYTLGFGNGRGYFRERIRAMGTIMLTMVTIVFALVILVYGDVILGVVISLVEKIAQIEIGISGALLMLRWPVAMVLYFLMVSYNYYVLPSFKIPFRNVVPGSIFASFAMLVLTSIFNLYTNHIATYDLIYGSLASVVALMFWFFLMAWALGLGLIFNKAWDETKSESWNQKY